MNINKKSHKLSDSSSSQPPTKLKIITNGNGYSTAIPANGKYRGRTSKTVLPAANTLASFSYVSIGSIS